MSFAEKEARRKHQRDVVDLLFPGVNTILTHVMGQVEASADLLYSARDRLHEQLAGDLMFRLEIASKLLDVPDEQLPAMIEEYGASYLEQVLHLAEQRIARVSRAIKESQ